MTIQEEIGRIPELTAEEEREVGELIGAVRANASGSFKNTFRRKESMRKYIVNLSGRLVRNSPLRQTNLGPLSRIPHIADRRRYKETPLNRFEKICWGIIAGGAVFFGLSWLYETMIHR